MRFFSYMFLIPLVVILSGCNKTKEVFGFNRNIHDEFAVARSARLIMPDDYKNLPEPKNQDLNSDAEVTTNLAAKEVAMGQLSGAHQAQGPASDAEKALLDRVGAIDNDPQIRQTINREAQEEKSKGESFVTQFINFKEGGPGKSLDATQEQERLKQEKAHDSSEDK